MKKELQDLAWSAIPPEVRKEVRREYKDSFYKKGWCAVNTLARIFGKHNLTSDEEPEEMLCVSAIKVKKAYDELDSIEHCYQDNSEYIQGFIEAKEMLESLFGKDKCLPDPSEEKPSNGAIGTTPPTSKLDVKPTLKFKVGDRVEVIDSIDHKGKVSVINEIIPHAFDKNAVVYGLKDIMGTFMEQCLAPYTEPEPQEMKSLYKEYPECVKAVDDLMDEYMNEPRQTEENMEEKELNLLTLLKGAIGETFYCPMWGDTKICSTAVDGYRIEPKDKMSGYLNIGFDGKADEDGQCILFPSRDLYLKYPLEAAKAWQEWSESRKPKRWRAELGEEYWIVGNTGRVYDCKEHGRRDDDERWAIYNYFCTKELAEQAAEAVKRALEDYHAKNAKK